VDQKQISYFKKTTCSCGNCGKIFDINDARSSPHKRKLYGIEIEEMVCPHCGSSSFTKFSQQPWLDRFIVRLKG